MDVFIPIFGGLVLLALGGEFLVRGSVQLAERLGVSPLLIGLTLVGFGTSSPELVTSVQAALIGSPGIAVGNVVGSNIANILLVLGISALMSPIAVGSTALKRDGVVVVGSALVFVVIGFTVPLDRVAGAMLVAGLIVYLVYAWRQESVGTGGHTAAYEKAEAFEELHTGLHKKGGGVGATIVSLAFALGGLVMVVFGGGFLVDGALVLARTWGMSETVIGLTIVAVGTSLPEFVTSVVAAIKRQSDVALGNILGSSIYNILGIAGITGIISPVVIPPEMARFDCLVMLGVSVLCMFFAWTGRRIGRMEGATLLLGYVAYTAYIWQG